MDHPSAHPPTLQIESLSADADFLPSTQTDLILQPLVRAIRDPCQESVSLICFLLFCTTRDLPREGRLLDKHTVFRSKGPT